MFLRLVSTCLTMVLITRRAGTSLDAPIEPRPVERVLLNYMQHSVSGASTQVITIVEALGF